MIGNSLETFGNRSHFDTRYSFGRCNRFILSIHHVVSSLALFRFYLIMRYERKKKLRKKIYQYGSWKILAFKKKSVNDTQFVAWFSQGSSHLVWQSFKKLPLKNDRIDCFRATESDKWFDMILVCHNFLILDAWIMRMGRRLNFFRLRIPFPKLIMHSL